MTARLILAALIFAAGAYSAAVSKRSEPKAANAARPGARP